MKEQFIKYKSQIITGVITTIIVSILHWIWDYIKQGLPIAGDAVFSTLVNSLYSSAATHNAGSSATILLFMAMVFIFGTLLLESIKLWKLQAENKKLKKLETQVEQLEMITKGEDKEAKIKAIKAMESLLHVDEPKKKRKVLSIVITVLVLVYLLWACIALIYPAVLWQTFDVTTIQIKPYISDAEMDMLKSKWTMMRSKEDFVEINKYIYQIREENGLIR